MISGDQKDFWNHQLVDIVICYHSSHNSSSSSEHQLDVFSYINADFAGENHQKHRGTLKHAAGARIASSAALTSVLGAFSGATTPKTEA